MFWPRALRASVTASAIGIVAAFLMASPISIPIFAQGVSIQGDNYGNACSGHAICIIGTPTPYVQFVRDLPLINNKDGTSTVGIVVQIMSPFPPNNMVVGLLKDPNLVGGVNTPDPVLLEAPMEAGIMSVTFGENDKAFLNRIQTPVGAYAIKVRVKDPNIKPKIVIGLNVT